MKRRIPSAAYHEARHAVVAALLGMRVFAVSMQQGTFPQFGTCAEELLRISIT
jgi:hypothetical protein